MSTLTARVRAGRLILDEPTTLPDGTELHLVVDDEGGFDVRSRAEIDQALDASFADLRAGRTVPVEDVLRELEALESAE